MKLPCFVSYKFKLLVMLDKSLMHYFYVQQLLCGCSALQNKSSKMYHEYILTPCISKIYSPSRTNPTLTVSIRNSSWRFRQLHSPICIVFLAHFSIDTIVSPRFLWPFKPLFQPTLSSTADALGRSHKPLLVPAYSYVRVNLSRFLNYRATRITLFLSFSLPPLFFLDRSCYLRARETMVCSWLQLHKF